MGPEGVGGRDYKEHKETAGDDGYALLIEVMPSWLYTYGKPDQTVSFKYGQFIVCSSYFIKLLKNI